MTATQYSREPARPCMTRMLEGQREDRSTVIRSAFSLSVFGENGGAFRRGRHFDRALTEIGGGRALEEGVLCERFDGWVAYCDV